jgi:hypothetical protein
MQPQRLVYFYSSAWNMDHVSAVVNGLPARRICGASTFSNTYGEGACSPALAASRVAVYRDMVFSTDSRRGKWIRENVHTLRGHNLFCICPRGQPCAGDVLIELANAPVCEEVTP